jgi:hypothetical protein
LKLTPESCSSCLFDKSGLAFRRTTLRPEKPMAV